MRVNDRAWKLTAKRKDHRKRRRVAGQTRTRLWILDNSHSCLVQASHTNMRVKLGSWNKPSHPRRPGVRLSRREKGKVDETGASEGNETFTLKKKTSSHLIWKNYHLGLSEAYFPFVNGRCHFLFNTSQSHSWFLWSVNTILYYKKSLAFPELHIRQYYLPN